MRPALLLGLLPSVLAAQFLAGAGRRDITPREPVPMWGYGSRHDALSTGTLDALYADALVIQAGGRKLAIVSLDLGRSPAEASLQRIRERLQKTAGIDYSFIGGSHTHHGPVLELSDQPGMGKGKFDAALRYYRQLEDSIVAAVGEADSRLEPVKAGAGSALLNGYNRNRHTRQALKPVDRELSILRLDRRNGRPLAVVVNFAAHPTMLPAQTLRFSADYCGALKTFLRGHAGAALFLQGAAGDLSVNEGANKGHQVFGAALGAEALRIFAAIQTREEPQPSLAVREERFRFSSRTDFSNPLLRAVYGKAFFPELIPNYLAEYADGIRPRLTVAVLNNEFALVGASGEFFSSHSIRLKRRARVNQLFFFGYANGYHQYFPTIEAVAEGGYGADSAVAPAEVGAGERMMDAALIWIYQLTGRIRQ